MADKRTRWIIEASSNIPDINNQLEKLIQLQRTQNDLTQQNTTSTALAIQRQREQIESLAAAQTKANNSTAQGGKQQTDMIGGLRKEYELLSKTLSGIAQLAAGAWAVGQLKTYVDEVIRAKSSQDGFVASMEQMLGSRLKAEELNAKLIQIALKSPFETEQLQEVTKKLQGMGVETQKIIPYINMLGDIAAIVGTDKLPLIAKALTDVQSKHVLMAQEIKQFTDNGVPLYDLLAKSMGKPVEQIRLLASEHKLVFEDVEKALMQATQKGGVYYGQMAAQSKQLGGQIANLGDMYTLAQAKIGDYFEKGIKAGIKASNDLIEATIGSDNAINRLITSGKAALAMWVSYRTAVLSIEAAQRANAVSSLSALGALEAQQVATVGLTFGTTSLSAAFNGLRVAFMSNPFGFVATAITSLISLFYTFKAATIEVGDAQNLEAENLRKVNREMEVSIEAALRATEGTKDRKDKIDDLIRKYPEYFAGMSAEKIQNADLQRILKDVNGTFEERIKLATLAYQQNKLIEKDADLAEKQAEAVKKLRLEYEKLSASNPSDEGFIKAIQNQQGFWDKAANILPGMLTGGWIESNLSEAQFIMSERKKLSSQLVSMEADAAKVRVGIEHDANLQKLKSLSDQLSKGEISIKEYNAAILSGTNELVTKQVKTVTEGEDKKKAAKKGSAELSIENDLKELKSLEKTYEVKMAILVTEEKLKIEQAKRQITNASDEQERILSIQKEYANKRNKLVIDSANENMEEAVKWFEKEVEANRAKSAKLAVMRDAETKEIKAMYKDLAKLDQELVDIQTKNKEKQAEFNTMYNAQMMKDNKKFWQDGEMVYIEGLVEGQTKQIEVWETQKAQLAERAEILKDSVVRQNEYKNIIIEIAVLEGKISSEEAERFKNEQALREKKNAQMKEYLNLAIGAMNQLASIQYDGAIEQIDRMVEKVNQVWDSAAEASKASFESQLNTTVTSMDQLNALWTDYAAKQAEILGNKQAFATYEDSIRRATEETKKMTEDSGKFMSLLSEGKWVGAIVSAVTSLLGAFDNAKKRNREKEERMLQDEREANELRIQMYQDKLDATTAFLTDQYNKYKESVDQEIQLAKDKYAALAEAERQYYSDSQLRLQEDDVYRQELVRQGEAREVAALEAAKARQLAAAAERGATAEEVARIETAFNKLIADKHKEYQEAIGNKSKETSLANIEVKAQEADGIDAIQNELNGVLDGFANALMVANDAMNRAIVAATLSATRAQMAIKAGMWEADKEAAIRELMRAEMQAASRSPVDKALIEQLRQAQRDIAGQGNPYLNVRESGYVNDRGTVDSRGSISKVGSYQSVGDRTGAISGAGSGSTSNNNNSSSGPANTPREPSSSGRFHGDTWVSGNSNGIDPITLQLHPGERILQSYLNQFLGPYVSNQELVHGYLQYANFQDRLPDISMKDIPSLQIPDFFSNGSSQVSMARVENKLDKLADVFANKSLINVNIDANNVTLSEHWQNHKVKYYDTLLRK